MCRVDWVSGHFSAYWMSRLSTAQMNGVSNVHSVGLQYRLRSVRINFINQGRNHSWKVEVDQGLGPNTRAPSPRARPKVGLGVECGRGSPPPAVRVRKFFFENSDAKSCILVTTCFSGPEVLFKTCCDAIRGWWWWWCEISWFLKTTAKKLGDQYTVDFPT